MKGYRTYIAAGLIVVHQILQVFGIDVPQENLSVTIDTVLAILAIFFRSKA